MCRSGWQGDGEHAERGCVLCVDVREAELEVGEKVTAWVCLRRPGRQCSPNKHKCSNRGRSETGERWRWRSLMDGRDGRRFVGG